MRKPGTLHRPHPWRRVCAAVRVPVALVAAWALLLGPLVVPAGAAPTAEADVFVAQAILAYEDKRYDDALAALQQALALDPDSVDALYYTGLVLVAQDRPDQAAQALERARALAPRDEAVAFQLGVVHFSRSDYDRAQPLLEEVFGERPGLDGLGYYVGFMRYRQKNYQGALRAFRAGASADPNIQQLTKFYTALSLAALGLPEQAAADIQDALRLSPTSPLTGPAERLVGAIAAARDREQRFRAEIRIGGFYDDNVAVIPNASGDLLVQSLRQRGQASPGELAAARFDYTFFRSGGWDATASFSFFTTYNNDLPDFNIIDYLGALTASYRGAIASFPFQATVQYTYDYMTIGGSEFLQRNTVAPVLTVLEDAHNLSALQLRYQSKQYSHDTNIPREEKRDADNWLVGLVHLFRFEGDRHFVKLGWQFDYEDTLGPNRRGLNYEYVGNRFLVGGQYTLPWLGIRLKYDFDAHLRDYQNVNTFFPIAAPGTVRRRDREYTSVLGAVLPLPYNLSFALEWQRIWDDSNIAVFSYTRNVVSGTLIWTY